MEKKPNLNINIMYTAYTYPFQYPFLVATGMWCILAGMGSYHNVTLFVYDEDGYM